MTKSFLFVILFILTSFFAVSAQSEALKNEASAGKPYSFDCDLDQNF
jgi:hypothetical protein